jgi:thiamine biosynthesis lipoprotein
MTAVLAPDSALPTATWRSWSCLVRVVVTDPDALSGAVADVERLMRRVELAASRFVSDSELCWANANAGRPVAISRLLVALIDTALEAAHHSAGAVDPTIGRDLVRLGYDRDIALVRDSDQPSPLSAGRRASWQDVRLDRAAGLLTVPAGAALDLGASAKAQTVDWAAEGINARYGCGVLVEIGGDLAVAGNRPVWQVVVAEQADVASAHRQQIALRRGGLTTSTRTIRRWRRGPDEVSHIIEPVSGRTADGPWRTVSVAADTAVHANTFSTGAIVLGGEALNWLRTQGIAARLIDRNGQVVTVGGWPLGGTS